MEQTTLRWLRLSYWTGAVVDFVAGWMMLVPALFALMNEPTTFQLTNEYRYAMGMGAPLMFGWTVLLLWADRKPFERKGILPITLLVVLGEIATQVWGISVGFVPFGTMIPTFVIQAIVFFLFCFAYSQARRSS
jgi:hypothetical protein